MWFRYAFQAVATTRGGAAAARHVGAAHAASAFQLLRGVLLLDEQLLAFLSLRYMPVGEFTAIVMIAPLVDHAAGRHRAQGAGLAAALGCWWPAASPARWSSSARAARPSAGPSCCRSGWWSRNAWFQVLTSKLARTEDPVTMHLYTGWVGALLASLALPFVWTALPDLVAVGRRCASWA